jgi:ketosteroid isomerase-like protein
MKTEEVAKKLVELCEKKEWMKAVDSLYAKDVVSIEPRSMEGMPKEMHGLDQVRGKTQWWEKNMEVHRANIGGPFVAGNKFVVQFDVDVTDKASKKRSEMSEIGIYTVKDGKVTHEEFLPLADRSK